MQAEPLRSKSGTVIDVCVSHGTLSLSDNGVAVPVHADLLASACCITTQMSLAYADASLQGTDIHVFVPGSRTVGCDNTFCPLVR